MTDTRNTKSQLQALKSASAAMKRRPKGVQELARALHTDGVRGGYKGPLLAMCDAILMSAEQIMAEAGKYKGDSPKGGDLDQRVNRLLGIYEQLRAAYNVADASGE